MAGTLPQPRVSRNNQNTQLTYELPHRIHTVKSYPLQSPNGSTIIIYGQENGVRILWRGGRQFKPAEDPSAAPKKSNGTEKAVISLDSDDEGPSPSEDKPEFEDMAELDPSKPYPSILQSLDLYFGTDVLHLALLPSSVLKTESASWRGLEPLRQKIVFTASCADNSIRLVTLPLLPPSPASKSRDEFNSSFTTANAGNGRWGESVIVLSGHQKPSDGVSMTAELPTQEMKGDTKSSTLAGPHLIIASHSREVTGLLLLFRVPFTSPKPSVEPFQKTYLPFPAKSITFNTALTEPPASQLLIADSTSGCRIYDYKLLSNTSPSDEPTSDLITQRGTWLLSLYPGFQKSSESTPQHIGAHAGFGRKTIVDAKWISNGRAIIVLLQDGEWGIWDIEGVGPGASQGLLGRQGIRGGSLTQFSLTGFIEGAKPLNSNAPQTSISKFAPMTPSTRKTVDLFGNKGPSGPVRGQISIIEVPSSSPTKPAEESIVFWLGDSFTVIPSLSKYWSATKSSGRGNMFSGTPSARTIKLEKVDLQGEHCSGIEQITSHAASAISTTALPSEIIILGEHRLVILSAGTPTAASRSETRMALVETNANGGELDVIGIDRALARMESRDSSGLLGKRRLLQ
ncbi:Nuclear pore NUP37 [Hyphodiscus hymeniophilus]|uniref:Nuclear pore NUP37 n=1 Tax=Hyphodiscus hymeniophilus TaxID=353542 RepID=A0A9P6VGJ9_9HELO|nr:Nuclear pore NUP37 [Hyphodiscus hymeniophilus]